MRHTFHDWWRLEILGLEHRRAVAEFERANRAAFEAFNESLGDDFYTNEGLHCAFDTSIRDVRDGLACALVVCDRDENILARATIHRFPRTTWPAELTYQTDSRHCGLGIATHAVKSLLELGARGAWASVEATTTTDNSRSIRLLQKLGFEWRGEAEHAVLRRGSTPCMRFGWQPGP